MRRQRSGHGLTWCLLGVLIVLSHAAQAQIVTPVLTPPPCQGRNCPNNRHGMVTTAPKHAPSACPAGTVRDPAKGTCHVVTTP